MHELADDESRTHPHDDVVQAAERNQLALEGRVVAVLAITDATEATRTTMRALIRDIGAAATSAAGRKSEGWARGQHAAIVARAAQLGLDLGISLPPAWR